MPSTDGPCRFGVYNLLNNIVLERLGWRDRVRIWSPKDTGYFDDMPAGTEMLVFAGMAARDFLMQAKLDVRPVERVRRRDRTTLRRAASANLLAQIETAARGDLSLGRGIVAGGRWKIVRPARIAPTGGRANLPRCAGRANFRAWN